MADSDLVCVVGIWHLGIVNCVGFAEAGYQVVDPQPLFSRHRGNGLGDDPFARCVHLGRVAHGVPFRSVIACVPIGRNRAAGGVPSGAAGSLKFAPYVDG